MQTIDDARDHCRFVGKGIEKAIAEGIDLCEYFENQMPLLRFKVDKDGNDVKVVGGEGGGDDSGIIVSESGVTRIYGDEIVGYAFDSETRAALVEFFDTLYYT